MSSQHSLDEAKRLRIRDEALLDWWSRSDSHPSFGSPSLVAKTKTIQTYPTTAQKFYACEPQTVLGKEEEGGAGTLTSGQASLFAFNLGTAIPPVGTAVLATFVESRWVFRYDG